MKESIEKTRHSLSHLMAMAILEKFPKAKPAIGPTVENGFYYDFGNVNLGETDLAEIEKRMRELVKQDLKFKKETVSFNEAKKIFKNQPYKLELIKELHKNKKKISIYKTFDSKTQNLKPKTYFLDLCSGPHVKSSKEINPDAFKLTKIAGAYWRGDEKNKMLARIYGAAFKNKKELEEYLRLQEEAGKRDHRKLGKNLDLFCFSDLVGPGLPLFTPKGVIIIDELKKHVETVCENYGFKKVITPSLAKIELFETSGHAKKFGEELFHVSSKRGHKMALKPVQCPHHTQIYASKPRSYKDLPIRYMESDKMYRAEKPGEIGGLNRVYAITVEDGHTFCRLDQIKDEIKNLVNIIKDFYGALGMWGKHWVSLSVRDPKHPEKYIGEPKDWNKCEKILKEVSDEMKLGAKRREGEAALYGPKLDFMFKDALGKEIQIPTVQLDFATPKRFNLVYTNEKSKETNPVMIHRAILGSYERFLVLLLEHFAGALPLWLSPVQAEVINVGSAHRQYAELINKQLTTNNIRTQLSDENLTVSKRIREGEIRKIPYILVVGDEEIKNKTVNVRHYRRPDLKSGSRPQGRDGQEAVPRSELRSAIGGETPIENLIEKILKEIREKTI
jgi:threonyl-tRNA synthetase